MNTTQGPWIVICENNKGQKSSYTFDEYKVAEKFAADTSATIVPVSQALAAPEMLDMIKKVEWKFVDSNVIETCVWCHKSKITGHAEDCPRQTLITKATQ